MVFVNRPGNIQVRIEKRNCRVAGSIAVAVESVNAVEIVNWAFENANGIGDVGGDEQATIESRFTLVKEKVFLIKKGRRVGAGISQNREGFTGDYGDKFIPAFGMEAADNIGSRVGLINLFNDKRMIDNFF